MRRVLSLEGPAPLYEAAQSVYDSLPPISGMEPLPFPVMNLGTKFDNINYWCEKKGVHPIVTVSNNEVWTFVTERSQTVVEYALGHTIINFHDSGSTIAAYKIIKWLVKKHPDMPIRVLMYGSNNYVLTTPKHLVAR